MHISRRALVIIAGCGCLTLIATGILLIALYLVFSARSSQTMTLQRAPVTAPVSSSRPVSIPVTVRREPVTVRPAATTADSRSQTRVTTNQYIAASDTANARSCPQTSCAIVRSFVRGDVISTTGQVEGEFVLGSSNWTRIQLSGQDAFIHSSLVSQTRPQTQQVHPIQPAQSGAAQPQPVQPPSDSRSAYPGMSCKAIREQYGDGNFTPGHPAYNGNRDRDGDGIACDL